jgi:hypothetical protein
VKKTVLLGLFLIALWFVMRSGLQLQATSGSSCSSGRFPFCADVNGDGRVDITDPVYTLTWLFMGGPEPICCADSSQGPADWALNQAIPIPGRRSTGRFKDNGDGTVLDVLTGLQWQQRTWDWNRDGLINEKDKVLVENANIYVKLLSLGGSSDWRLPTLRELESIIDRTSIYPAMDPIFQDTRLDAYYWSSSLDGDPGQSFVVEFKSGSTSSANTTQGLTCYMRAVRNP